ncbi:MAG: hypothetical protein HY717_14555 [Planctomycetes bacterium]|nr:hypothetical protein [Planctomycetota bacterium]
MVAWIAGLAVLAVIAIGIASWPHILTNYYIHVLRTDRSFFPTLLRLDQTPSRERALWLFLKTTAGRQRLFECCLEGMTPSPQGELLTEALEEYFATEAGQQALREAFLTGAFRSADKHAGWSTVPADVRKKNWDKVVFGLNLINGTAEGVSYEVGRYDWHVTANHGGGGGGGTLQEDENTTLLNIIDFLKHLRPGTFPVSKYPDLECKIDRKSDRYVWCQVLPK